MGAEEVELTYTYEEGENPEEFFLPYIWENAVCALILSPY